MLSANILTILDIADGSLIFPYLRRFNEGIEIKSVCRLLHRAVHSFKWQNTVNMYGFFSFCEVHCLD